MSAEPSYQSMNTQLVGMKLCIYVVIPLQNAAGLTSITIEFTLKKRLYTFLIYRFKKRCYFMTEEIN